MTFLQIFKYYIHNINICVYAYQRQKLICSAYIHLDNLSMSSDVYIMYNLYSRK